jgi:hypothetical protein
MIVPKSFDIKSKNKTTFEPSSDAWYVILIGPYQTTVGQLDRYPDGFVDVCECTHRNSNRNLD